MATAPAPALRPAGLRLLRATCARWARSEDPDAPGSTPAEQFQAQISSALRAAGEPSSPPRCVVEGAGLAAAATRARAAGNDQNAARRLAAAPPPRRRVARRRRRGSKPRRGSTPRRGSKPHRRRKPRSSRRRFAPRLRHVTRRRDVRRGNHRAATRRDPRRRRRRGCGEGNVTRDSDVRNASSTTPARASRDSRRGGSNSSPISHITSATERARRGVDEAVEVRGRARRNARAPDAFSSPRFSFATPPSVGVPRSRRSPRRRRRDGWTRWISRRTPPTSSVRSRARGDVSFVTFRGARFRSRAVVFRLFRRRRRVSRLRRRVFLLRRATWASLRRCALRRTGGARRARDAPRPRGVGSRERLRRGPVRRRRRGTRRHGGDFRRRRRRRVRRGRRRVIRRRRRARRERSRGE